MSIFSYDSKVTNVFSFIGDMFILNVVYLACCLPIVTIGAAQAGLHSATRVLIDKDNDNSALKAFFKGFKNGFWTVTAVHTVFIVLDLILLYTLFMAFDYRETGLFVHWALPLVMLFLCLILHSLVPLFHSKFGCKPFHLFRNCLILLISRPLRSLAVAVIVWAPLAVFFLNPNLFLDISVLFITVYFSVGFGLCAVMMQKPFDFLIDEIDPDEEIEAVK